MLTAALACRLKATSARHDLISKLPLELILLPLALLSVTDRVRFSQTSTHNNALCTLLLHHETAKLLALFGLGFSEVQLMLLATGTVLSGSSIPFLLHTGKPFLVDNLDFYTSWNHGEDVVIYLCRMGGYTVVAGGQHDIINGTNASWVLRNGWKTINVVESLTTGSACMFYFHATHMMGFWDGSRIFHAYPALLAARVALTTPHQFMLEYTLDAQCHVWRMLHKYIQRGFHHQFEHDMPHQCGHAFSCPATLRTTTDGGCLTLYFPTSPFRNKERRTTDICWSLFGTGCQSGILATSIGSVLTRSTEYEGQS